MAEQFYEVLALAAFALLGLWWVVVANRRREWSVLPYRTSVTERSVSRSSSIARSTRRRCR